MMGDTLSDAAGYIKEYQEEMPDVFEPHKAMIDHLVAHMDAVRCVMDSIPGTALHEEFVAAAARFLPKTEG